MTTPDFDRKGHGDLRTPSEAPPNDEATGLPGIRTWRSVYWVVFGIFVLWISLLTWLTRVYS